MKNILYVFPVLGAGGAEKSAIMTASYLAQRYNYNITFYSVAKENYYRDLFDPSIQIVSEKLLPEKSIFHKWINAYLLFYICLSKYINKHKFDIVVSGYEFGPELSILQVILRRLFSKSTIQYVAIIQSKLHDNRGDYHSTRNYFVVRIISFLRRVFFDKIVAVAPNIVNEVDSKSNAKISVIPNPVNSNEVIDRANAPIDLTQYEQLQVPFFINIARITPQKNQLFLLKAFNLIKYKTDTNMLLIGDISDQSYFDVVEKYITDNCLHRRVLYLKPPANHFPLVHRSKAFLFTSLYEGFPLALLEAMILRKMIVSTRFDGYESLLSDRNSILVEKDNINELAKAILFIDKNNGLMNDIQTNAFATAQKYELQNIAEQYHQLFNNLG